MGFGTEIFFFVVLGVIVLGPKRLHTMIGHMARARARFEETTEGLKSQLGEVLGDKHPEKRESPSELSEDDWTNHASPESEKQTRLRLTQEQSFGATGYESERVHKIFLNSDIDFRHFYFEGDLNRGANDWESVAPVASTTWSFPIAIGYEIIAVTQKAYNGVAIVATSDENDCKGSRQLLVVLNAGKSTWRRRDR